MDRLDNLPADPRYDLTVLTPGTAGNDEEAARGGGSRAARLRAAKAYIAANSSRQGVSVGIVATYLGLTPRSLQRLFEADGTTLSAFLLDQRLICAYRMLRDPQFSGVPVSSIAYDAGFGDLSYFNRRFRRLFGTTPKVIRGRLRIAPGGRRRRRGSIEAAAQNAAPEHAQTPAEPATGVASC